VVSTTPPPYIVALWDWVMAGGEAHESAPHALGTRELLLVIEGELDLSVGATTVHLLVGDSAAFGGDEIHAYRNPNSQPARFALVVFEPDVERTAR
jgi:quercetin dioxygenase-like cupin family protein